MLLELRVKNLALIEKAEVCFKDGLNILTDPGAGRGDRSRQVHYHRLSEYGLRGQGIQGHDTAGGGFRLCGIDFCCG